MIGLTIDDIRDKAVAVVNEFPTGIRQIDLIQKICENIISPGIDVEITRNKVRNAIWDLEKKRDDVTKIKLGPREAVFVPRAKKVYMNKDNSFSVVVREDISGNYSYESEARKTMLNIWYLMNELEDVLSKNHEAVARLYDLPPNTIARLDSNQINTLMEVKHAVDGLRRARSLASKTEGSD
jgi:hypothetical protein